MTKQFNINTKLNNTFILHIKKQLQSSYNIKHTSCLKIIKNY